MSWNVPMSRDEKLLRKLLGQSIETEEPQSRIELLLKQIIEEGGVGGSYKIKDSYATLADLEAAHPTGAAGDAYLVGDPAHVYVWAEDSASWKDGGAFSAIAGPAGNGITSIEKTSTAGLVDTYTITFDDGDTETFNVTNGAPGADGEDGVGIVSIEKTSTVGLVDTYTITLTDGNTYDFTVTNGSGGSGVPEGGTTGQVLAKKSNADGDVEWVNQSGGSDVSSEIASLSASASEAASNIASLSTENSTQSSEIGSLSASASEAASELDSLSSAVSEVDSTQNVSIGSLTSENSTQNSQISSLSVSMSEMASAVSSESTAQSELDSTQNASINSLTSENSTQNSELSSLSAENSTQTSEISSLSTENSTQTSEIDSLSTAASELGSENAEIKSELAEKQDELVEGPGIDIDPSTNEIKTEVNIFTGTIEAWNALTTAEKLEYTHAAITNDTQTGIIDLVPVNGSLHAVSSGGVYDALAATAKTASPNTFDDVNAFGKAVYIKSSYDVTEQPAQTVWGDAYIQFIDKNGQRAGFITTEQNTDGTIDMRANMDNGKIFVNDQEVNGATYGLARIANKLGLKIGTINVSGTYDSSGNIFVETGHNTDHLYIQVLLTGPTDYAAPILFVSANGSVYLHGVSNSADPVSVSGLSVSAVVYYIDLS